MRLVIVSNRLPVTVVKRKNEIKFQRSMGGLVSGLDSYLQSMTILIFQNLIICG